MILAPIAPNDAFTFAELESAYNFRRTSDRRRIFSRLIIERAAAVGGAAARVLDIGCGRGIGRRMEYVHAIRAKIGELWGIEPSPEIGDPDGNFDHFQNATMETAQLEPESFDLAYSYMVMEHVDDPEAFLAAVRRALRPGGEYLFITPNGRHYFTRIAALLHRWKLDEFVLRVVKPGAAEEYHYPVRYKCNQPEQIAVLAEHLGFEPPRFAYLEPRGPASYLPGPLRPVFWVLSLKRRLVQKPEHLVSMIVLLRKPPIAA